MIRHLGIILIGIFACTAGYTAPKNSTEHSVLLINTQRQFGENTLPRNLSWLALYCKDLACEIRNAPVKINITKYENSIGEMQNLDEVSVQDKPVALLAKTPFKTGKVTTWFREADYFLNSPQYLDLKKSGKWKMPSGKQSLVLSAEDTANGGKHYSLSDGKKKQALFDTTPETQFGVDKIPVIHWIGDMDNDGKPDVLLSIPDDKCKFDERLYLSSRAAKNHFLGIATQHSGSEAACGC